MACKKASIPITATSKEVCQALEKYGLKHGDGTSEGPIPTSHIYTPEVFLDAIIKWIVADDQVSIYQYLSVHLVFLLMRAIGGSPST
jgi:hypothetical protein